ncbi:hypothetical protein C7S20_18520 [Christiangramia fulva]|uniref:Uncharacterized protein n=1 Tax=Christiangramia fulva TaxID=2126553 RepID=A0A2R3Z9Z0_9FLAO|nr:hypothetical protein C7S20_18520 [Christiangramia fulva]
MPDPEKASDIYIHFLEKGESGLLKFTHFNFENHGEGFENYCKTMDSEMGWDYILKRFKEYCEGIKSNNNHQPYNKRQ